MLAPAAPDAREREQVVDQRLHALGAVDGEVDVLVGALVELAAVAASAAPGRSSRPCAAAPAGRARRRRRTARARRWSAAARAPARSSCSRAASTARARATIRSRIASISSPSSRDLARAAGDRQRASNSPRGDAPRASRPSRAQRARDRAPQHEPRRERRRRGSATAARISSAVQRVSAASSSSSRARASFASSVACRRAQRARARRRTAACPRASGAIEPRAERRGSISVGDDEVARQASRGRAHRATLRGHRRADALAARFQLAYARPRAAARCRRARGTRFDGEQVAAHARLLVDQRVFEFERGAARPARPGRAAGRGCRQPHVRDQRRAPMPIAASTSSDADRQRQQLPDAQRGSAPRRRAALGARSPAPRRVVRAGCRSAASRRRRLSGPPSSASAASSSSSSSDAGRSRQSGSLAIRSATMRRRPSSPRRSGPGADAPLDDAVGVQEHRPRLGQLDLDGAPAGRPRARSPAPAGPRRGGATEPAVDQQRRRVAGGDEPRAARGRRRSRARTASRTGAAGGARARTRGSSVSSDRLRRSAGEPQRAPGRRAG